MSTRIALVLLVGGLVCACGDSGSGGGGDIGGPYDVTVTRTTLGIPHIKSDDFGSLGYGYGYSHAEDNLCVLMEDIVTVRGERAKWFGRDGSYSIINAFTATNVNHSFFWKFLATDAAWQRLRDSADPELRAATTGFADGWNRYVREIKSGGHGGRHKACRDAGWLTEITEADMYRRYYRLALIASSSVFVNEIASAQPPVGGSSGSSSMSANEMEALLRADPGPLAFFTNTGDRPFGSNMYALGKDAVAPGSQSMVFGNPHFPWAGPERLYISHLTVPGRMDIMGSSLYGVPAVLIGFNDHVAWSHTVSTAYRFGLYELTLAPGDPTSYVYQGATRKMQATPVTVEIREVDGSLTTETRTLYRSHFGPMTGLVSNGQNILPWSTSKAFALRDANAENDRLINQFARWNQAQSLDEFIGLHKTTLGIPWVNTIASGPNGKAYYGDVSVVPHVTDAKAQQCSTSSQAQALAAVAPGLPLLDGSLAACEWGDDTANPDADGVNAPAPGIFGPKNLPTLQRDDWVHNCNDSYWLSNPAAPITGFAKIVGPVGTERSLRTRLCMQHVLRHLDQPGKDAIPAAADSNSDKRFTLEELQNTVLSSQIYSAQLARDEAVNGMCATGTVPTQSGPVNVAAACNVLRTWDRGANLDSVGAHIWREFFRLAAALNGRWTTPFSASNPVNTPRGLNVAQPQVQDAFGRGIKSITDKGFALDAALGSLQHPKFIDQTIPIFGGEGVEGAFTIVTTGALQAEKGYEVFYGNSYIQTVTWEPDGDGFKPRAEGFITYSQSTDPASPHFSDFTSEYSAKRWKRFPFTPAEIEVDKISRVQLTN